ncbi:MAG: efflux RND transporter periplasmic adaptor subunit [bacterium]|nr:efflux RND transporter periplasmic adaptor subunit [Gammaproteobacteria bacterium]HIL96355.1 efflux RND transporter periplasmic adaptor subunit [Pseudomonadales bacterium]
MMKVVIILSLTMLIGCGEAEIVVVEDQSVRPARIFQIRESQQTIKHEFVGRVDAAQSVDMSFEVSGQLAELPVLAGQTVARGTLIASLDTTDFELSVREAGVQLKLASQGLKRKMKLLDEKGISPSVVDDARAVYELWQVRYDQSREALADAKIVAPFEGYIARRYTNNHVNVRSGDKIVRINDLSELFIYASIPEKLLATVTPERVLSQVARFDFAPGEVFPLDIRENAGEADEVAQTYRVTFVMPNPENKNILPGMTASVEVEITANLDNMPGITVPITALVTSADKSFYVWVFEPKTQLVSKQTVEIGSPIKEGVPIISGLKNGDLIVATGASQLQAGMKIRRMDKPVTEF